MQARHLFWVLLRDQVGPLLRAEGFGGSGQSWRLEHPSGNAALIQVQRSRWNTTDSVQFTINLAVASKVVWDWQLTRESGHGPAARPSALYTGMRLEPVAASVVEALHGRAIPLLGDHLTDAALCRWLDDPQLGWPTDTWRLVYLSVLLATHGPNRRLDQVLEQLQARVAHDPRPPWLAEHVTDMRQRALSTSSEVLHVIQR